MSVIMRAVLSLAPGCRLYYDCPLKGESFHADEFFDTHHGKPATFLAYSEKLVSPLDHKGRLPGRYIDRERIKVQFDDEEPRELNILHFVVADKAKATFVNALETDQCISDLPHPVLFYSGDMVRFIKKPDACISDAPRLVREVLLRKPFAEDSIPRYMVMETEVEATVRKQQIQEKDSMSSAEQRISVELHGLNYWNASGDNLELIERGNVWALYNDPKKLAFISDGDELGLWTRDGVSYLASDPETDACGVRARILSGVRGKSLEEVWDLFTHGEGDMIMVSQSRPDPSAFTLYRTRKLHDCFAHYSNRVRALTERVWKSRLKEKTTV